jgi:hypothetical protein
VARGDPVDGIGVVRYLDAARSFQLLTKSYRPRTAYRRGYGQLGEPLRQLLRAHHGGLPEAGAGGVVEGDEDLAAVAVEDREALARRSGGGDPGVERVEAGDAARLLGEARGEPFRGRDPDPQTGERARPEPDRDQVDPVPTARRVGATLDLGEEPGRVPWPSPLREPEVGLGEDLAVAPGAGGRVRGRGVEADDDQCARPLVRAGPVGPTSRGRRRSRPSCL